MDAKHFFILLLETQLAAIKIFLLNSYTLFCLNITDCINKLIKES